MNYEDCTPVQKGALASFKKEYFDRKILKPTKHYFIGIMILSGIALRYSPYYSFWYSLLLLLAELAMYTYFLNSRFDFFADNAMKSRFYRRKWAENTIAQYEKFIKLHDEMTPGLDEAHAENMKRLRRKYTKQYNHAERYLACRELSLRK